MFQVIAKHQSLLRNLIVSFFMGISTGVVYAFIGSTFSVYLHESGISVAIIGLLAFRLTPYSYKFLYAPFVESIRLPFFPKNFGQRRSWMISMQVLIMISISSLALINQENIFTLCFAATFIALLGATHDIALGGYRVELFSEKERGRGTSINILGFRSGFTLSGVGGLFLTSFLSWKMSFLCIASFILPSMLILIFVAKDNKIVTDTYSTQKLHEWFKNNVLEVIVSLVKLPKFYFAILIVAFFKVSDAYLEAMLLPFLLEIGFSKLQLATVVKSVGVFFMVFGTFIGAWLVDKMTTKAYLIIAECLSAATNLLFITLLVYGANIKLLFVINALECTAGGIVNVACINYMSSLCNKRLPAASYAVLYSISALIRFNIATSSGFVAQYLGWKSFFITSALLSLPSIIAVLLKYRSKLS